DKAHQGLFQHQTSLRLDLLQRALDLTVNGDGKHPVQLPKAVGVLNPSGHER
ncbi:MAG: hypothetical protein IMZ73_08430, partial [Chloroflexi bacterium]|nr:hypothetical protein [Chloroflexota bacterium]